jgi:RND family efflux transporter MFP subunit
MKTIKVNYKTWALLTALIISIAALSGCSGEDANANQYVPPPPSVTVKSPLKKSVTHYREYTGTTEALESVDIRARVEGVLEVIHFVPGAEVEKGELLFTIDEKPFRARLEEAKADLEIRKAELELAETTSFRREKAFEKRAVSEVAVLEAKASLSSAKASVVAAKAAVKRARLDLSYTKITAPISGRIGRNLVDAGNLVGAVERTLLTSITQSGSVYVYFTMSENDLHIFNKETAGSPEGINGTPVTLDVSGNSFAGIIDFMESRLDSRTGTIGIRGIFSNEDKNLIPGMYGRIQIPFGAPSEKLLVPDTALGKDLRGRYVLVAGVDDKVRYQPVTTGILVEGMRVIKEGVTLGDKVIVNGLQKAMPGAKVTPVEEKTAEIADAKKELPSA